MKVKLLIWSIFLMASFYFVFANGSTAILQATEGRDSATTLSHSLYLPSILLRPEVKHDEVFVAEGEFQMGCDPDNNGGEECNPILTLHAVYLDDYYIDKFEVTNAKFAYFLNNRGANDCGPYPRGCMDLGSSRISLQNGEYVVESGYGLHPANSVTWFGAEAYCAAADRRLPTEAEWEKAARGSEDTRQWPWGDETPSCDLVNYRACVGDTSPVGSFPGDTSPYGAMDMAGNLGEWTNDRWDEDYYSISPYENPQGPDSAPSRAWPRVRRGAGWNFNELSIRVFRRDRYQAQAEHLRFGFRCARTP